MTPIATTVWKSLLIAGLLLAWSTSVFSLFTSFPELTTPELRAQLSDPAFVASPIGQDLAQQYGSLEKYYEKMVGRAWLLWFANLALVVVVIYAAVAAVFERRHGTFLIAFTSGLYLLFHVRAILKFSSESMTYFDAMSAIGKQLRITGGMGPYLGYLYAEYFVPVLQVALLCSTVLWLWRGYKK